jgi:superfamily I DNA/RNA helicase
MLGRDLGKNLERLSRDIIPKDETPADACAKLILEWRDKEISLARANGKEERVEGIDDRAQCLLAVLHGAEVRDAGSLRLMLRKMFARESGQVALSSIHKAKGLEWDLVLHLDPWRIPSKWAKQAAQAGHMSQMEQEWNLLYVAETRTRDVICEGNLEDFEQT